MNHAEGEFISRFLNLLGVATDPSGLVDS